MAVTVGEVYGRVGVYIASAENLTVRPQNIRKTLKINHLNLHRIVPALLRDYLTTHWPLDPVQQSNPYYAVLDLSVDSSNPNKLPHTPKELRSVTFAGSSSVEAQPYKPAISLEHFRGLSAFDEEQLEGRYWFQDRGAWDFTNNIAKPKLEVYQGQVVRGATTSDPIGTIEGPIEIGYVREFEITYASAAEYAANKDKPIDCPAELIEYLVKLTSYDLISEKKNKFAEYLGQDLRREEDRLIAMDQAIAKDLQGLDLQGRDIR